MSGLMHAILIHLSVLAIAPMIVKPFEFRTAGSLELSSSTESVVVNIFKISRFARMWEVEAWLASLTRPGNPVKLSTLFDRFVRPGSSCFGNSAMAKICLVHRAYLVDDECSFSLRLPNTGPGQYIIESFEFINEPRAHVLERPLIPKGEVMLSAESHRFTILFADEEAATWAKSVGVHFHKWSWTDLIDEAFDGCPPGQVIEFGTGQGTVTISALSDSIDERLVAFHDMDALPIYLLKRRIDLLIGPIKDTIESIDSSRPISFIHINLNSHRDVDFIISKVSCLLQRDSVVMFSGFFNGGAPRSSLPELMSRFDITIEFLPSFFETSVAIRVVSGPSISACKDAVTEIEDNASRSRSMEEYYAIRSLRALGASMKLHLKSSTKIKAIAEILSNVV